VPSAPEAVHSEAEANGTAHDSVHVEPELCMIQCHQLASSSEVIVDSDSVYSVYSVCCSDVTTDTRDSVHIDHEPPPVTNRGMACHSGSHLSYFFLLLRTFFLYLQCKQCISKIC